MNIAYKLGMGVSVSEWSMGVEGMVLPIRASPGVFTAFCDWWQIKVGVSCLKHCRVMLKLLLVRLILYVAKKTSNRLMKRFNSIKLLTCKLRLMYSLLCVPNDHFLPNYNYSDLILEMIYNETFTYSYIVDQ